ncbi:MAG: gliding motility-associated C-terminal domain-containing protein [Flavipsychrobacter sp.]
MRLILLFTILLFSTVATAQKQNNNWCFGRNAGVSFNTSPPSSFVSNIITNEGVAAISDRTTGTLIFYASTANVYNKNFAIMPNGTGVGVDNAGTCAQGVHIAPFVNDTNKYYVFTLGAMGTNGRLSYSVVDMTLDGGLGDVVAGQKYIPIDSGFAEAMVITEGCGSYWLITYKRGSADHYAYKITSAGINTVPVISTTTYTERTLGIVTMKVSPDRKKLGIASWNGTPSSFLALHDFSPQTGQLTNGQIIDTRAGSEFYGCEFSPNSLRLYVSGYSSRTIYQYDLTQSSPSAIKASKKAVVPSTGTLGALQLAPDSNIYAAIVGSAGLGRISNANTLAPGCVYTAAAIPISATTTTNLGLPQAVVHSISGDDVLITSRDTSICLEQPIVLYGRAGRSAYEWQDGSTQDSFIVNTEGKYWVRSPDVCDFVSDTINVISKRDTTRSSSDTFLCNATSAITLSASVIKNNATYLWNTGSTSEKITINSAGKYWVATTELCDVIIDSIEVDILDIKVNVALADTTICRGDTILISGSATPTFAFLEWSNGSTQPVIKAYAEGKYILTASHAGCTTSDEVYVSYYPNISIELGESREICDDQVIILPEMVTSSEYDIYLWQDGSTNRKYSVTKAGTYYVQVSNRCQTVTDTITITTRNCKLFFPTAFTPNRDGRNDIARFIGDITNVKEYTLRIYNRWGEQVYTTIDISQGWDGTYKGIPAELGTYYYVIKYFHLGEDRLLKGDLLLIR